MLFSSLDGSSLQCNAYPRATHWRVVHWNCAHGQCSEKLIKLPPKASAAQELIDVGLQYRAIMMPKLEVLPVRFATRSRRNPGV